MVLHSNLLEPHLVALLLYNKVEGVRGKMEEERLWGLVHVSHIMVAMYPPTRLNSLRL